MGQEVGAPEMALLTCGNEASPRPLVVHSPRHRATSGGVRLHPRRAHAKAPPQRFHWWRGFLAPSSRRPRRGTQNMGTGEAAGRGSGARNPGSCSIEAIGGGSALCSGSPLARVEPERAPNVGVAGLVADAYGEIFRACYGGLLLQVKLRFIAPAETVPGRCMAVRVSERQKLSGNHTPAPHASSLSLRLS